MSEIKLIFCVVIGVLVANFLTYYGYESLNDVNKNELIKSLDISRKKQNNESFSELKAPKINITLKNGSFNQLNCGQIKESQYSHFLSLNGKNERSYENIDEGEYIGCSFNIDNRSSTILHWFHVVSPGVYTLLFEQVECQTCIGIDHTWATIIVDPNGKKEYPQMKITVPTPPTAEPAKEQRFKDQYKKQPECFEKSTGKIVSCGNDYIREKAAFNKN